MKKVTPVLWMNNNVQEAIDLYTSVFKDVKVNDIAKYPEGGPMPAGTILTATITLFDEEIMFLNGGPDFKLNESFSFMVMCDGQEEVDNYWNQLTADGGEESQCGWLKDKFGLSWQIVPKQLHEALSNPDPEKAQKSMQAMMGMKKIVIADL